MRGESSPGVPAAGALPTAGSEALRGGEQDTKCGPEVDVASAACKRIPN